LEQKKYSKTTMQLHFIANLDSLGPDPDQNYCLTSVTVISKSNAENAGTEGELPSKP
jgi:hypothetical protein